MLSKHPSDSSCGGGLHSNLVAPSQAAIYMGPQIAEKVIVSYIQNASVTSRLGGKAADLGSWRALPELGSA